ncbi:MAG: hypothetical protein ACYS30_15285 [Planctomycetota bacterium]
MMKNVSVFVCKLVLGIILCALVFLPYGCGSYAQLGETEAEARRRHLRTARINRQELAEDIDKALLLDKPSKLTDKRIP